MGMQERRPEVAPPSVIEIAIRINQKCGNSCNRATNLQGIRERLVSDVTDGLINASRTSATRKVKYPGIFSISEDKRKYDSLQEETFQKISSCSHKRSIIETYLMVADQNGPFVSSL